MTVQEKKLLRQKFEEHESDNRLLSYRRAAVLGTVFILAAASLDWVVFPELFATFFVARLFTAFFLMVVLIGFGFVKKKNKGSIIN